MSRSADSLLQGSFGALVEEIAGAPPIPLDTGEEVLAPGTRVDGVFEVVRRLGAGGMGVVYLARDTRLGRDVALKVMRLDRWRHGRREQLLAVFEREARATARLHHDNVVTLHHFGTWEGTIYLVLELLRGHTLAERLATGPLPLAEALGVVEQILAGLDHAHTLGIIHRDLKPQNVFLTHEGRVKLLDFGLAGLTRDGESVETPAAALGTFMSRAGTPAYMAPEQWRGEPDDERTDLWQAGVTMYQLITGELPHVDARSEQSIERYHSSRPINGLLERLLARDPADRPATAAEVLGEIRVIRRGLARGVRRRVAIAGAACLAMALAAWSVWPRGASATGTIDLGGTWAYAPEGRAGVTLSRLGEARYLFEYTDATSGEQPSPERFYIRGELTLSRHGDKLVLAGDVIDVPGWGKGQVGAMSFDVLSSDRLLMTRSEWGKTRDNYVFAYPSWLLVRVSGP